MHPFAHDHDGLDAGDELVRERRADLVDGAPVDGDLGAAGTCERRDRQFVGCTAVRSGRLFDAEDRVNALDVVTRLFRQFALARRLRFERRRARIVGGEHFRIAVLLLQPAKIGGAREDVVARIVRIVTETVCLPHVLVGLGHHLHDAHCAGGGRDRLIVVGERAAAAFHADHGLDPVGGNLEAARRFLDVGRPTIDELCGAHRLFLRERFGVCGRFRDGDGPQRDDLWRLVHGRHRAGESSG